MRGRRRYLPLRNGYKEGANGDPERQIRRVDCQENPLRRMGVSVPQTDTGGRDEYSKALG
jgi:hypothetical protein